MTKLPPQMSLFTRVPGTRIEQPVILGPIDKRLSQIVDVLERLESSEAYADVLAAARATAADSSDDAVDDALEAKDERLWAAHVILSTLPDVADALLHASEAEIRDVALAMAKPTQVVAQDTVLTRASRLQAGYELLSSRGANASDPLAQALRASFGRDAEFAAALQTLGISNPEALAQNFAATAERLLEETAEVLDIDGVDFERVSTGARAARRAMTANVEAIFGAPPDKSGVHALVTMPNTAAAQPELIDDLYAAGMTAARINCAHDDASVWGAIVANLRERAPDAQILMDIAGPKNRTGNNAALPNTIKVKVGRNEAGVRSAVGTPIQIRFGADSCKLPTTGTPSLLALGNLDLKSLGAVDAAMERFVAAQAAFNTAADAPSVATSSDSTSVETPSPKKGKKKKKKGKKIKINAEPPGPPERPVLYYPDGGGRLRTMAVDDIVMQNGIPVGLDVRALQTTYFAEATPIFADKKMSLALGTIGPAPLVSSSFYVRDGDEMVIKADPAYVGHMAKELPDGTTVPATIGCRLPEAFAYVDVGQRVLIDDGAAPGVIEHIERDENLKPTALRVRIGPKDPDPSRNLAARRIKGGKGINFPDAHLDIPALTDKDRADLRFVAKNADIIAYSFVQNADDVKLLVDELDIVADELGLTGEAREDWLASKTICAKIETRVAVDNLPSILSAIREAGVKCSVMIARGDLAVETGFDEIGSVQQHVAEVCTALNVPFIYATGVQETAAKQAVSKRGEWIDIDTAVRKLGSPVVMFNKGDFMSDVLRSYHAYAEEMMAH